jgi:multidrug efflux pump subunit AcrA (membrane-fusion protein)
VLATAALPVAGCTEVESETATGYEPSTLEPVKGNDDIQRVTFTAEGARRVDLQTAPVRRNVVPYAALIYDPEGKTYVYTSPKPLEYLREEVKVDRIEGDRVLVSRGPPAGTEVVTVGAAEVYGTELEVPSH